MSEGHLGLFDVIAISLGAIIGGGIFAVLGIASAIAGMGIVISYILGGIIALTTAYSYINITNKIKEDGGSFTFLEFYYPDKKYGGIIAWLLIFGYIGSMSMYAYAFGAFIIIYFNQVENIFFNRITVSILILLFFYVVNKMGIHTTTEVENIMVYTKVLILFVFGVIGIYILSSDDVYYTFAANIPLLVNSVFGLSIIFVSFQGFQVLAYEFTEIRGGLSTYSKGIFISILVATLVYILVAIVTILTLTPGEILEYEDTVLAYAAKKIFTSEIAVRIAFLLIVIAAIFSTASAINATLFSTIRLTRSIAIKGYLPRIFEHMDEEKDVPYNSLKLVTVVTILFTIIGSLKEISAFASFLFLIIFLVVNFLAFKDKSLDINRLIPIIGQVGCIMVIILFTIYNILFDIKLLLIIFAITISIIIVELVYLRYRNNRHVN